MRGSYATAGIVAGLGLLVALAWGAWGLWALADEVREMPRTAVPGEVTVEADEAGGYVVYHERETWFATFPSTPDVEVAVRGPDGRPVTVTGYRGALQYRTPGLAGQAVVTFDAETAGAYTVRADGDAGGVFAVGSSVVDPLLRGVAGPIAVLLLAFVAAIVIVLRGLNRRSARTR